MPKEPDTKLERRVAALEVTVESLRRRLDSLGQTTDAAPDISAHPGPAIAISADEDVSEELLSWVGRSSLLPRISTLCFLLVVALALRTVTDHEIVARTTGSILGMVYASALIGTGWLQYRRNSALAPVFTVCGGILMAVIVVEIHAHYQALPSIPAYLILLTTGVAMALISYLYRATLPIILGTLGMGLAGVAIDYPNPVYPLLAALLLAANGLGFGATLINRCSWLRWILILLTITMMTAWALKLGVKIPKGDTSGLYPDWYLPSVAAIFLFFTVAATAAIFQRGALRTARFDLCLPLLNVLWAFPGAAYVVEASGYGLVGISLIGLLIGCGYFFLMFRIGTLGTAQKGAGSFALAGVVLCALSLYTLLGNALLPLPVIAATALFLCHQSDRWHHGSVRLIATLVQVGVSILFSYTVLTAQPPFSLLQSGLVAAFLAAINYAHYRASLSFTPTSTTWFYGSFDQENRTVIILLLSTLACSFFTLRAITHTLLSSIIGPDPHVLVCADSAIINTAATALMLFAYFREYKDIRNIAVLVTLIGAIKVFLFDLFSIAGFPLVISVLIFGISIFFQSVAFSNRTVIPVLGQKRSDDQAGKLG
jgi:hypothetical protein